MEVGWRVQLFSGLLLIILGFWPFLQLGTIGSIKDDDDTPRLNLNLNESVLTAKKNETLTRTRVQRSTEIERGPTDDSGSGDGKDEFSLHALPVLDVNKTVLQQDGDGEEKIEKGPTDDDDDDDGELQGGVDDDDDSGDRDVFNIDSEDYDEDYDEYEDYDFIDSIHDLEYPDFGRAIIVTNSSSSKYKTVDGITVTVQRLPKRTVVTWCHIAGFPLGTLAHFIDTNCGGNAIYLSAAIIASCLTLATELILVGFIYYVWRRYERARHLMNAMEDLVYF